MFDDDSREFATSIADAERRRGVTVDYVMLADERSRNPGAASSCRASPREQRVRATNRRST